MASRDRPEASTLRDGLLPPEHMARYVISTLLPKSLKHAGHVYPNVEFRSVMPLRYGYHDFSTPQGKDYPTY